MVIVATEGVQAPLETAHWNTLFPTPSPVTAETGEEGVVILPVPEMSDQDPVPKAGTVALNVEAVVPQRVWSGPALATEGGASTVTETVEVGLVQPSVVTKRE